MQQEEEVVTLPGIRERMALFKKAGKKIVEEISNSKQQQQRVVGKLDPKKADVKSFVSTASSEFNIAALKKPVFNVQSGTTLGDSMQLDYDIEISESDLAEASNMVKSSKGSRYKKSGNNSGSVSSPSAAATRSSSSGSKERGAGATARPRFGRTYSLECLEEEPMQKPQKVKDKEEAAAKEAINVLLQKEMGDDKIASSFPSIRVRYLTAMGTLRPDYYDSSESIRNLTDPVAVRKRLAEKRKIEAERKRRYDKLKSAWEDYEEVAQDKPTELTEEDAQIERDLNEIEADIAQEWQEFTEDVIRVAEEQAEADADAAAEKSDDDEMVDHDNGGGGEDSDVERWREEARRLKADAAARRKRREAHLRHRQARKLKAKNDLEGAREILAQAAVNMKEARTLRDEARKDVVTIDVDALVIDDDEDDLLGESQLSLTEGSNPDEEGVAAAAVTDGLNDEKKEDQSGGDASDTPDGDDDNDDDNKTSGNKSSSRRSFDRSMRPGMMRGNSFDDDEEPKKEEDNNGQSKPTKHVAGGANRGMRPGVMRGRSFGSDDEPCEPKEEEEDNDSVEDSEENECSEAEKVSQKKKSKSKKGIYSNDEQEDESSSEEHISGHKKKNKKKQKSKLGVVGDRDDGDDDDEDETSTDERNYRSKQNKKGKQVSGAGSEEEEESDEEEESSDDDKKTSKKKSHKATKSFEKNINSGSKSTIRMQRRASIASTSSCSSDEDMAPIRQGRSLHSNPDTAAELVPGKKKKSKDSPAEVKASMKGSKVKHHDSDTESHGSDSKASLASKTNKSKSKASARHKKEEPVAFDTYPSKNLDGSDWINPFKAWTNKPKKTKMEGARINVKVPEKTDNWRKTRHNFIMDNAPFYWHKVSGSFQVMVKVTGDLGTMYDKAGLMIRLDEENWIMTGMEYYNNQMNHSTCVTHDYTDWSLSPLPASTVKDGAWFCLKRIGNSYEAFYSLDGNNWIQTRQGLFNDAQSIQVGIFCACPMGESYKVSFDMYRCKNLIE